MRNLDDVIINTGSDADDTVITTDDAVIETDNTLVEPAAVYPVSDEDRIGVSTDEGTNPVVTDQGDEQTDAVIWGTPDAPGAANAFPPEEDDGTHGVSIV
jgi:hypothetical protein